MPHALITGASQGLGLAIARALAGEGWDLVLTARDGKALQASAPAGARLIPGDVSDPLHRSRLAETPTDLLVNNASLLGPMPPLAAYPLEDLRRVLEVDLIAPLALTQLLLPAARTVVNVTSDAAVEAYAGWGGYGLAKAALDHATACLAVENPDVRFLSFDPGDLRTAMHQEAFPGQDISDRPLPETVVPAFLRLLELPSGRYRAADLMVLA